MERRAYLSVVSVGMAGCVGRLWGTGPNEDLKHSPSEWDLSRNKIGDLTSDGLAAADLTANGLPDLVVGGDKEGNTVWYEHPGDPHGEWLRHPIAAGYDEIEGVAAADVDGDGTIEVFTLDQGGAAVIVHHLDGDDPRGEWSSTTLDPAAPYVQSAVATDVDGDDHPELVYSYEGETSGEGGLYWLDYQGGDVLDPASWSKHELALVEGAWDLHRSRVDLSGDGSATDIIATARTLRNDGATGGVFWLEEPADVRKSWDVQWINRGAGRLHVAVGDFSGSDTGGDIAVIYDWEEGAGIEVFEYPIEGDPRSEANWQRHVITDEGDFWNIAAYRFVEDSHDQLVTVERSARELAIWSRVEAAYRIVASHPFDKSDDVIEFLDIDDDGAVELATPSEGKSNRVDWWDITTPGG